LSLHDALPISRCRSRTLSRRSRRGSGWSARARSCSTTRSSASSSSSWMRREGGPSSPCQRAAGPRPPRLRGPRPRTSPQRKKRTFHSDGGLRSGPGLEQEQPRSIIVDDDRDTRELLAMALESEGFEVTSAANGLRLISSLQLRRPHLILLDVNMSWIDGFELCKAVKKNEGFRDIPVVFVSGRGEPEDR